MSELGEKTSPPVKIAEPVDHIEEDLLGLTRTINFSS